MSRLSERSNVFGVWMGVRRRPPGSRNLVQTFAAIGNYKRSLLLTLMQAAEIRKTRQGQVTAASGRHQDHPWVSRVWSHLVTSGAQLLRAHGGNFPVVLMPNRRRQGSGARQSS